MKHVILTGGTGMIGSLVLKECLDRPDVEQVTSIVRRPSGVVHAKLREVLHADPLDLSPIMDVFTGQDIAFYCLGAYTGALSKDEFRKVTVDYTIAFAKALKQGSPQAVVCFLSGQGADRTEKARMQFARDKGAAENFLFQAGFPRVFSFRPGYIYPVHPRREPNAAYRLMRTLYKPLLSRMMAGSSIPSTELAAAMVQVGSEGHPHEVLENRDIRHLRGLDRS
ncbi:MAG: NAD(P)H-binding protein [Flavobacteriales bacterium]|nr:NAD(P)H-binding protein [Flavobacteriales bacterium]